MRKLTLPIAALVAVLVAVALAGPAFGGAQVSGSASALGTAKKAVKIAKRANKRALLAINLVKGSGSNGQAGSAGASGQPGASGQTGATGPRGPKGEKGDKGDAGIAKVVTRTSSFTFAADNGGSGVYKSGHVECADGEVPLGGGADISPYVGVNGDPNTVILDSRPGDAAGDVPANGSTPRGWFAAAREKEGNAPATTVTVYVNCGSAA